MHTDKVHARLLLRFCEAVKDNHILLTLRYSGRHRQMDMTVKLFANSSLREDPLCTLGRKQGISMLWNQIGGKQKQMLKLAHRNPVSYTHLTLPTRR